ncbi:anaerobic glycerol-3-phosphate dehydrogenase subunit A [Tropicimonas sp. IMCC6043]|uniref:anaerobic glycerol-3-phosphate dehydrogenase subunit A n=1 Tax=Tropicimonas sp. IMCC6043 TaxID=2510645 RepID=UPI00101BA48E|nr:anaerobic glycerol-3-phosphate dehydrogenase subunit A [Tropicimonas sp. IMCC6043]RYH12242.1 anaerobic glycerol-3-phosphate dehydrogenase subunit A [Tropicimonas sp. IMCC6043]
MNVRVHETEVLIIGAGATGSGIMRDLALRGIHCLLIDRRDLNAGASGGNHGLLHSGGRYATADAETAAECRREGEILKRLAPECIDDCGGLFVAVEGDDPDFAARFPEHCRVAGIPCEALTPAEAREREPALPETVFAAYTVPDATIDPFRIVLENVGQAQQANGSRYLPHTGVEGFDIEDGEIVRTRCRDHRCGDPVEIRARQVVNASGAWAEKVARLAGCTDVTLLCSKGTLLISNARVTNGVVNRLRPPDDGDILVPGGTVSLLGTSSVTVEDPDDIRPTIAEVDRILAEGAAMLPILNETRFVRAFSGVRPLLRAPGSESDGRKANRGFALFDHEDQGLTNFVTVAGGKFTTFRLMAEKAGDLVARRLGNSEPCKTALVPLPSGDALRWTDPGAAARDWYRRADPTDMILCECEMVARSAVDTILAEAPGAEDHMSLRAIALRSRIGKGACQGAFCALRVMAHLYDRGVYDGPDGLRQARDFVEGRFRGVRPVLWGAQMPQAELAEILHCGLAGMDLAAAEDEGRTG